MTYEECSDILGLISKQISEEVFNFWTEEQKAKAVEYAGACHFRASDNNNKIPPQPKWVKNLSDFQLDGV